MPIMVASFPKIIMHNSVSLDGSFVTFEPNMGLHYQIAGSYKADAHLIGSVTAKTGIEMFQKQVPPESDGDFRKPERSRDLPYWIIVDPEGMLKGLLHVHRRFEYCRDVIVLVSKSTPQDYIDYLNERRYDHYTFGDKFADLRKAIEFLAGEYDLKKILTDTGRTLNNVLLNESMIREISLLIHPIIVGKPAQNLFSNIEIPLKLRLIKFEPLEGDCIWTVYVVEKNL